MNAKEVKLGNVYGVKVGDRLCQVKIHSKSRHGGWDGMNLATGRQVRIKTAARLRYEVTKTEPVVIDFDKAKAAIALAEQKAAIAAELAAAAAAQVEPKSEPAPQPAAGEVDWTAAGERWMAGESLGAIAESLGVKTSTLDRQITKRGFTKQAKLAAGYRSTPYKPGHARLSPA
jgi:hypothetical protein